MADPGAPSEMPHLDVAQLVGDYHQVLYRYAYRLTGSGPDAEDLTQQTFLVAQQKLAQLRQAESARSWLFTILRNCYLKGFRRQLPIAAASLDLTIDDIPEPAADAEIDREQLQAGLDSLSDDFKLVLMLFYFEERPYQEIAQLLEIPVGTVMSRLSRAKAHLRKSLLARESDENPSSQNKPDQNKPVQSKTSTDKSAVDPAKPHAGSFEVTGCEAATIAESVADMQRELDANLSEVHFPETNSLPESKSLNTERPVVVRR